jgi:hypothetical protein
VDYFLKIIDRKHTPSEVQKLRDGLLGAYRWQYIVSGVEEPRFQKILNAMTNQDQRKRIETALAPIIG